MYAIIEYGGKQYKIEEGNTYDVELLKAIDGKIDFKEVLLLNDGSKIFIGTPHVKNCTIKAEVVKEVKGPKVIAYKYKRRKNYHRKKGHRQKYTKVKINKIEIS